MPRKKQGPQRLDAEAQEAARFVMGSTEDPEAENNTQINKALTESIRAAPADAVGDILMRAGGSEEAVGPSENSREYTVIIDDSDEDSYHSSEDEDFVPTVPKRKGGGGGGKARKKKPVPVVEVIEEEEIDEELEGLLEDAQVSHSESFLSWLDSVNLL